MTADTSLTDDASASSSDVPDAFIDHANVRVFAKLAVLFLVVSTVLGSIAAVSLVNPTVADISRFLSYGRLYPVATNLFINGWLTLGFLAVVMYLVPRLLNRSLAAAGSAVVGAGLYAAGVIAAAGFVTVQGVDGNVGFEAPWYIDFVTLIGVILISRAVALTVRKRPKSGDGGAAPIPPVVLFLTAGVIWLTLALAVALPFGGGPTTGLGGVLQNIFARGAIVGLWLTSAGFGAVYYISHRITGAPIRATDRSVLAAFWSVAVVMPCYGATQLAHSVMPDWLETVGAMFAIGALLPALILANDLARTVRSRIDNVTDAVTLKWLSFGTASFVAFIALTVLGTIRSVAAVAQLTTWTSGIEFLALGGAFTAWLVAFYRHAGVEFSGRHVDRATSEWHLRLTVLGVVGFVLSSMSAGVVSGYAWIGAAISPAVGVTGVDFALASQPTLFALATRGASLGVFALGAIVFAASLLGSASPTTDTPEVDSLDDGRSVLSGSPVGFPKLVGASVGLFIVAMSVVWLIPSTEVNPTEGTILGDTTRMESDDVFAAGKAIYLQEGCVYCHTQQVRPIVTDVDLGAVSAYGDYVNEDVVPLGVARLGPDLMHAGTGEDTGSVVFLRSFLEDPRAERSWSTMPSYAHLSDAEIEALAIYLTGLK